jgi:hypothetical protein
MASANDGALPHTVRMWRRAADLDDIGIAHALNVRTAIAGAALAATSLAPSLAGGGAVFADDLALQLGADHRAERQQVLVHRPAAGCPYRRFGPNSTRKRGEARERENDQQLQVTDHARFHGKSSKRVGYCVDGSIDK